MAMAQAASSTEEPLVNDSHFHLTNYIQEGADIHEFLKIMGNKVDGLRCSGFRCSSNGLMRTPVTWLLRITFRLTLRSTITPLRMRALLWRTDLSLRKSRHGLNR
jgi:hypothetical protein